MPYEAMPIALPPNKRMHPTPLRVERDRGDFDSRYRSTAFPFYQGGAGDAQGVGPQH